MPEWGIDSVRFSVFTDPNFVVPPTLWRDCVGDEPETSTYQRANATKVEVGPFAEGRLTLQVQPMRVDWVHEPLVSLGQQGVSVLGPFPDAADPLLDLSRRWASSNSFPGTPRIALGLVVSSSTTDRASGYRELANLIEGVPTNPEASDFMYQVNIPRTAHVDIAGLKVNRLSKWGVALIRQFVVAGTAAPTTQVVAPDIHCLRLELDINTNPDFEGLLPRRRVTAIIDDLFDGAKEICEGRINVR